MGSRNYLIEGVSGAGKTSVAEELERRGYHVVHGDRRLAYRGDPLTGLPLAGPAEGEVVDQVAWVNAHWIWPVDEVRSLAADRGRAVTFFCGGSRNWQHFIDVFDKVFVLEIDRDTLQRRLAGRPEDEFGGRPEERELIVRLHASQQDLPRGATVIDATVPLEHVVDAILSHCGVADQPGP